MRNDPSNFKGELKLVSNEGDHIVLPKKVASFSSLLSDMMSLGFMKIYKNWKN